MKKQIEIYAYILFLSFQLSISAIAQNEPLYTFSPSPVYYSTMQDFEISPDESKIVLAGNYVSVWDMNKGEYITSLPVFTGSGLCADFSLDGKWLAVGYMRSNVKVYNTDNWEIAYDITLEGQIDDVSAIKFIPHQDALLCYKLGKFYVVNYHNSAVMESFQNPVGNDFKKIYIYDDRNYNNMLIGNIAFFNINLKSIFGIDSITESLPGRKSLIFSNNYRYLLTREYIYENENDFPKKVLLSCYDFITKEKKFDSIVNDYWVASLSLSPNASFLFYGIQDKGVLVDLTNPKEPKEVRYYPTIDMDPYRYSRFTKDGKKLLISNFYKVYLHDISDLYANVEGATLHK